MPLLKVNQLGQIEQCEMDYEETLGAIKTRSMVAIPTSVSSADRAAALAAVAAKDAEKTAEKLNSQGIRTDVDDKDVPLP